MKKLPTNPSSGAKILVSDRYCIWWKRGPKNVLGLGTLQRQGLRNAVQRPPVFCVGLPLILLMEEILHHLGCIKPCKKWGKLHRGVSKNRGTPKSCILVGFSIINHPIWGTPIFWEHPYQLVQDFFHQQYCSRSNFAKCQCSLSKLPQNRWASKLL